MDTAKMGEIALKILMLSYSYKIASWQSTDISSVSVQTGIPLAELTSFAGEIKKIVDRKMNANQEAFNRKLSASRILITDDDSFLSPDKSGVEKAGRFAILPALPRRVIASEQPILVVVRDQRLCDLVKDSLLKGKKAFQEGVTVTPEAYDEVIRVCGAETPFYITDL